ncbi:MAG: hypothetical protein LBT93_04270 [Treponema sp.]|nr:hypothetical protein [Treponema sp.]
MFLKRVGGVVCLSLLLSVPLSAATVSFLVIETGLWEGEGRSEFSTLWETGLMDVFFDSGHIVSNAPIMRLPVNPEGEFPDEAQRDLEEAREGGAEFFVLALLDYAGSSGTGAQRHPRIISLKLFRIDPYGLLFEQRYTGTVTASANEEFFNAKKAAQTIIPHLWDK